MDHPEVNVDGVVFYFLLGVYMPFHRASRYKVKHAIEDFVFAEVRRLRKHIFDLFMYIYQAKFLYRNTGSFSIKRRLSLALSCTA